MIEAGNGTKRIQLDEHYAVMKHFLSVMAENDFPPTGHYLGLKHDSVVDLVGFVLKYECEAAIALLAQYTRTRCTVTATLDEDVFSRLLVAMHLERDDLVTNLFESYPAAFQWLTDCFRGPGMPNSLPYSTFVLVPSGYLWALATAEVWDTEPRPFTVTSPEWGSVLGTPRLRFEQYLMETKEHEEDQRLKALRISSP